MKSLAKIVLAGALLLAPRYAAAQAGERYAVLIGGLGGSEEYTDQYRQYLFETRKALVDDFGFSADHVVVLAENSLAGEPFVTDVSTAENIAARFAALAGRVTGDDHVYVVLFGHGSYDGQHARLNIPRRDLDDDEYAGLIDGLSAGRVVFINTASASAPFVAALSAPDRIVITATRTGTQRNETVFPRFLVEALASASADLDRDGDLSVREVFAYASEKTAQSFAETNHLATEHALLEDTGDARGYRLEELEQEGEGNLAALTYLRRRTAALASVSGADRAAVARLLGEKETLERDIADLKSRKSRLGEEEYYNQLEQLFVRLARLNDRIEGGQ